MAALGTTGGRSAAAAAAVEEEEGERAETLVVALSLLSFSFSSLSSFSFFALAAFAFAAHSPALAPGTEGPATPLAEITTPFSPSEAALSAALAVRAAVDESAFPPLILFTSVPHDGHFAAENLARQEAEGTPPDHMPASQTLPCSSSVAPP